MRIALGLQYDGSPYSGWQSQVNQSTIQDELEKAISSFVGIDAVKSNPIRVITAGRTDTGVHALGQVVHFDVEVERENWSWVRGVNTFLPESIVVNWAQAVPEEFSARYSAHERTYIYALHAGPCRSPMAADRAGYVMLPPDRWFDVDAMREAAQCLIGEHDFTSFRSSECQSKTPVKTMYSIEIFSNEPWLYFKIKGNAFLHHMVRNLVGSFIQIGVGKQKAEWMAEVLAAKDRSIAAPTFSPAGLYLAQIAYPDEFQIPQTLACKFLATQGGIRLSRSLFALGLIISLMGLLTNSPGRTRVKICGLKTPADVDAAVAAGVDAVGFVFYPPSPRAVTPNIAAALISRLPAGVDAVGLVVNASDAEFEAIRAAASITLWQFHGDESPEECERLAAGQPWMKAARVGAGFAFDDFSLQYRQANAFLLDALVEGYGGGGVPFDWSGIPQAWISANAPQVVLSGGLNVHNVGEAIARLHPCAVDVSSGVEISKGVKDHALMKRFIEAVRAADASTST